MPNYGNIIGKKFNQLNCLLADCSFLYNVIEKNIIR